MCSVGVGRALACRQLQPNVRAGADLGILPDAGQADQMPVVCPGVSVPVGNASVLPDCYAMLWESG